MLGKYIKAKLIDLFIKFLSHERVQTQLIEEFSPRVKQPPELQNYLSPYQRSSGQQTLFRQETSEKAPPIIITGRFRSGSTLLWNMFRQIEPCISFYEPFNERQWFNKSVRGEHTDNTHIGVEDYWLEYDNYECLTPLYNASWYCKHLHMGPSSFDANMREFIAQLIHLPDKRSVLQFNRIDFRLGWIKQQFPDAIILHIYRNPRDQFLSFIGKNNQITKDNLQTTFEDRFYLNCWAKDLQSTFPFLNMKVTPHPYQRFYYLWKLSYLYGIKYASLSIQFEELIKSPKQVGAQILKESGITADLQAFTKVVVPSPINKWQQFADEQWFSQLEQECEQQISVFFTGANHD